MDTHLTLQHAKTWVIKVGSSLVTNQGRGLDQAALKCWVSQIAALHKQGKSVVLVSSGAVAEGMARMGWDKRPSALQQLQAVAAIGQSGLIQAYESIFGVFGLRTAQILLTHEDLSDRKRYLNARATLLSLLELGVIPIVNENDSVAADEIRFGDNDRLSALVANLIEAQVLAILTDQDGLFTQDPSLHPDASLIKKARVDDEKLKQMAGASRSGLGRGGMITKIEAAVIAARSGTYTLIGSGRDPHLLQCLASGGAHRGTLLEPGVAPLDARKRWILGHLQTQGALVVDDGAAKVIRAGGKSLLAIGITRVDGDFQRGAVITCKTLAGEEVAKGLVNYSSTELRQILGKPSSAIKGVLGCQYEDEVMHRDNMVNA